MARRSLEKRHTRSIQKLKRTYYISIPIEIMRSFKWREKQKVVVKKLGRSKIIISDWKKDH